MGLLERRFNRSIIGLCQRFEKIKRNYCEKLLSSYSAVAGIIDEPWLHASDCIPALSLAGICADSCDETIRRPVESTLN